MSKLKEAEEMINSFSECVTEKQMKIVAVIEKNVKKDRNNNIVSKIHQIEVTGSNKQEKLEKLGKILKKYNDKVDIELSFHNM